MFKKTSDNAQSRATRAVVESRANTGGIDLSAFTKHELEQQRIRLVERKKMAEDRAYKAKSQLKIAAARVHEEGKYLSTAHYQRLVSDKDKAIEEIREIERELSDIKMRMTEYNGHERQDDRREFSRQFMQTAREILARPVYDRIVTATIHRIGEQKDE